jgi:type II secretory pathway pseudopilin PulG
VNRCLNIFGFALHRRKGFTFVEILAAMLFMAIVIPVALRGVTIANRAGVVAERSRVAAELADSKLTEVVLTEDWRNGAQNGYFDEGVGGEDSSSYRWALETKAWEKNVMRLITVRVFYTVQGKEYEVSLSTLAQEEQEVAQ